MLNDDPRYASGTSLSKTKKEEALDSLEKELRATWTDGEYLLLKKCPLESVKLLHRNVKERLDHDQQ